MSMHLGHDIIVTHGTRLPPAMGIFGRLQAVLRDSNSDLDDIVSLVRVDPGLTFQVIKLSNSALYGLKNRCESLEQAVARVGFGDIHQLVGLAVAKQSFQDELAFYDLSAGRLWENAVAAGVLMSALAKRTGADDGAAYSTGLLRNIGKIILNNYAGAVLYPGEAACPDVHAWEKKTHGMNAAEVSAVLLDHWRFPAEMVATVRHHIAPEAGEEHAAQAARMHLACAITTEWGCALPGEAAGWRRDAEMCRLAGIREEDIPGAAEEARAQFGRCAMIEWSNAA